MIVLIMAVLFVQHATAQVNISIPPAGAFQYSLFDMAQITLDNTSGRAINSSNTEIICKDQSGNQIFDMKTSGMNLAPGNNMLGYTSIASAQITGAGEVFNALQQTGSLPAGVYSICVTVRAVGVQQPLGMSCLDVTSAALGNLYLLSPEDEAIIETQYPTFNWMTLNLKGKDMSVKYAIRVCLLQPSQTYSEAIVENAPLLYEQNLSTNSATYPGSAPLLDTSQKYVWQVEADVNIGGHITKSYSEIWMFQFGQHAPADHKKKKKKAEPKQYVYLTKSLSSGIYVFDKYVNFRYINEAKDSLLNYHIYELGKKQPVLGSEQAQVVLTPRVNYISIPISKDMQQNAGSNKNGPPQQYLLDIRNSRKEDLKLKFIVIKNKKGKKKS